MKLSFLIFDSVMKIIAITLNLWTTSTEISDSTVSFYFLPLLEIRYNQIKRDTGSLSSNFFDIYIFLFANILYWQQLMMSSHTKSNELRIQLRRQWHCQKICYFCTVKQFDVWSMDLNHIALRLHFQGNRFCFVRVSMWVNLISGFQWTIFIIFLWSGSMGICRKTCVDLDLIDKYMENVTMVVTISIKCSLQ